MGFKLGELNVEIEGLQESYQALKVLLSTEKGTLAGDPLYGVNIADLIPYTNDKKPAVSSEILNAIGRYMPDIRVKSIEVAEATVTVAVENLGTIVV
jgi:phage baseplate assembly protein W